MCDTKTVRLNVYTSDLHLYTLLCVKPSSSLQCGSLIILLTYVVDISENPYETVFVLSFIVLDPFGHVSC